MGAWIEILSLFAYAFRTLSLPSWERGLKYIKIFPHFQVNHVAPFMGAWIEIVNISFANFAMSCRSLHGSVD